MNIEQLKTQIRFIKELLEKPPYQNDGMKKQLETYEKRLKELENGDQDRIG